MMKRRKVFLTGVAIAALGIACFARKSSLSGKMVAYDPLLHAAKGASFVANKEAVIIEMPGRKTKYLKIVFVGYGTTQIDAKYFGGALALTVKALRDHSCDETDPRFATQVSLDQTSGTFLLTDAFKNSPPPKIKTLECYDAPEKK
ncbi:MAG: hypothetical protein WAM79_07080 [Candidatus Sulfotelmatobacter sp.]